MPLFPHPFAIPLAPLLGSTVDARRHLTLHLRDSGNDRVGVHAIGTHELQGGGNHAHAAIPFSRTWMMPSHSARRPPSQDQASAESVVLDEAVVLKAVENPF